MIESNYKRISDEIARAGKGRSVKLIGASKTMPAERIQEGYDAGMRFFGENRIQEGIPKIQSLPADIEWHFIGHLQTNKARDAVRYFSWIQSVDSLKLLNAIEKEAAKVQKQMSLLLEINLGNEETKGGLDSTQIEELISTKLEWCAIHGLMAIPPFFENPEEVRPYFQTLRKLAEPYSQLTELSMGMSHDYIVAIEEGATIVRIGTALFGERL
jgi:pyridoxal phosphate enzyme (YggS family)